MKASFGVSQPNPPSSSTPVHRKGIFAALEGRILESCRDSMLNEKEMLGVMSEVVW